MKQKGYGYMVRTDSEIPTLIRYADYQVEMYRADGEWERTPGKDTILLGDGDWVWYDDITEEEAKKYMAQIKKG